MEKEPQVEAAVAVLSSQPEHSEARGVPVPVGEQSEVVQGHPGDVDQSPRRLLKIVLTLRPSDGTRFRALLAVGAEGCDPLLRSLESPDLVTTPGELPAVVAEAERRWADQPRYPTAAPTKAARPTTSNPVTRPATTTSAGTPPASAPPDNAPDSSDQLALFG
jgi:hypothetical protein